MNLLLLTVFAHSYAIRYEIIPHFLLQIAPAEDVLEVAITLVAEESFVGVN